MTDDFVNLEYAYKLHDTKNKKKIISKKSRREKRNSKIKFEQLRENIEFPRSNSLDIICS